MTVKVFLVVFVSMQLLIRAAVAEVDPAVLRQELERIENLRLLHWYSVQNVHDCKTLAVYLAGWGGPNRGGEAESLMQECEDVYGVLRGVDHGGMSLQAEIDGLGKEAPSAAQFDLLARARVFAARHATELHARTAALKNELTEQVNTKAAEKAKWTVTSKPEPWPDRLRDADRAAGVQRGVAHGDAFFKLSEEDMNYSLVKAAKTGYSFANLSWDPACNWAAMEPEQGKYDYAALDAAIARYAKHGMRVCLMLRSLTATPPPWHIEKHGDGCRLLSTLKEKDGSSRQAAGGVNIFHEPTGEVFGRFLSALAAHLKEKWSTQIDAVYIEGRQPEIEAPIDESPAMDAFWRTWSKTRTPWRTPEALLADANPDAAAVAKAEMCREAWLLEYARRASNALRRGWPELRVQSATTDDDFHRLQARVTGRSRDVYALCGVTDNPSVASTSPASMQLLRSFGEGRWLWAHGSHSGCGATPAACFADGHFHDVSRMVGGWFVGNIQRDNYPSSWFRYRDKQLGDTGIASYFMVPRRVQQIGPVILNTATPPAEVAVLWCQSTRRLDRSWQLFQAAMSWGHLLNRISVRYDYIPENGIEKKLANCKVLILPNTQSMRLDTCDAIRSWVKEGGTLLGFGAPGLFDELAARRKCLPLSDVFGADVARMRVPTAIYPDKLETTHSEGSFTFGNVPPRPYKFETNVTAALKSIGGTERAWFPDTAKEPAIIENAFGKGRAMLCGFPLGFEYWECAVYELTYGLTHSRHSNYNYEQKRYEAWVLAELTKLGVTRKLFLPRGDFLRAQRGDDPDWFHIARNGPEYSEYMFEEEKPVRTVNAYHRVREGIDNIYIGLAHTEGNYFWERALFRCMLSGARIEASVEPPGDGSLVFDARLGVPVPSSLKDGRIDFSTWLPMSQAAAFAVAPGGNVRLFGNATPTGISPEEAAQLAAASAEGTSLAEIEILQLDQIAAFIDNLNGGNIVIGCGDARFRPVAQALADWLQNARGITARITVEAPRTSCRFDYMDSFGWPSYGGDPVHAAILIGNCQDNGLMWKFLSLHGSAWLPLEINQNFPGIGRAVVMLSSPVISSSTGQINRKDAQQQLVIGATFPSEAMRAVKELQAELK